MTQETFKFGAAIGFQNEFGSKGRFIFDTQIGIGLLCNKDFSKYENSGIIRLRLGVRLFS